MNKESNHYKWKVGVGLSNTFIFSIREYFLTCIINASHKPQIVMYKTYLFNLVLIASKTAIIDFVSAPVVLELRISQ
jgi:hypothetical protein